MTLLSWLHTLLCLLMSDWLDKHVLLAEHSEIHKKSESLRMQSGLMSMQRPHSVSTQCGCLLQVCVMPRTEQHHCCMRLDNPQIELALGLTFCSWLYNLSAILCKHMTSTACTPRQGVSWHCGYMKFILNSSLDGAFKC